MPIKIRLQTPPELPNYQKYKKYLRIEFDYSCAYCNIREPEIGGSKSFHIDHYRPKKKFPKVRTDYLNLLYSCRDCNSYKGDFWPSPYQFLIGHFILNPCNHDFDKHFDRTRIVWVAKSKTADWNLFKLRLNSPSRQEVRKARDYILKLIGMLKDQEGTIKRLLSEVGNDELIKLKAERKLFEIQEQTKVLIKKINGPMD